MTVAEPSVAIAIALFGLVSLAACYIPGARVTRLDPVQALRQG